MKSKIVSLTKVPYGVFLLLFVLSLGVSIFALRQNNQTMIQLRSAVYEADEKNGDVEQALSELRNFVYSHMNTNLASGGNTIKPPLQLKFTYERLVNAEQERVDAQNSSLYTKAQQYCQQRFPSSFTGGPRVPCITQYVTSNGGDTAKEIPAGLYKFDFISPTWSPDLAGWSLVATLIFFIAFVASFLSDRMIKKRFRDQEL